nr:MAG TPA: hypothetical protein [Caudoviricetes sp.]DAQ24997.1 MAG TPA: hypothetical protein [Bacteriophage sp.]
MKSSEKQDFTITFSITRVFKKSYVKNLFFAT